jgi:hypothetical protein
MAVAMVKTMATLQRRLPVPFAKLRTGSLVTLHLSADDGKGALFNRPKEKQSDRGKKFSHDAFRKMG